MKQARFDHMATEHETILKSILFPLTVKLPHRSAISVRSIVRHLKPFHPWLDEHSLREFVQNYIKKRSSNNKSETSKSNLDTSQNPTGRSNKIANATVPNTTSNNLSSNGTSVGDKNGDVAIASDLTVAKVVDTSTSQPNDLTCVSTKSERKRKRRLANCKYYKNKYNQSDSSDDEDGPSAKKPAKSPTFDKEYIDDANKIGIVPLKLDFGKGDAKGE